MFSQSLIYLLHRANQQANAKFLSSDLAITSSQMIILCALQEKGKASQIELTRETGIDRSTMSDIIKRLAYGGFIVRSRSKADTRAMEVELTEAGHQVVLQTRTAALNIDRELLSRVRASDQQAFMDALRALTESENCKALR